MSASLTVFIVDDDAAVRDALALLCDSDGLPAETFDSAEAFIAACRPEWQGCIVLDVRMPAMSGPELQDELSRRNISLPIIFLTAHGDIPTTVRAIKGGAVDFLTKPIDGAVLLQRIREAFGQSARTQEQKAANSSWRERFDALTEREREVMALAAAGHPNKEIARRLGISHRTVEIHRARVMRKLGAANLIELSRIAEACGLSPPSEPSQR